MFKASEVLSKSHQAEDLKSRYNRHHIVDEDAYMRELPLVPSKMTRLAQ